MPLQYERQWDDKKGITDMQALKNRLWDIQHSKTHRMCPETKEKWQKQKDHEEELIDLYGEKLKELLLIELLKIK